MPLFECEECHAVENTSLGQYWYDKPKLCSECATGTWHGEFEKQTVEEAGMIHGDDGFLYEPEELEPGGYFYGKVKRRDSGNP